MKIELTRLFNSLSIALDYVEQEILDVDPYHGKRVAYLTDRMARTTDMDRETLIALTQAAGLHDCALSEYLNDEFGGSYDEHDMSVHCVEGERMLSKLPFYKLVEKSVLYHHDCADGSGATGAKAENTPLTAQLIHLADRIDVKFGLYNYNPEMYDYIVEWVRSERDKKFSGEVVDIFMNSITEKDFSDIAGDKADSIFDELIPDIMDDVSTDVLRTMASIFADITDYKSHFTWNHSQGVAEKAEKMGHYYGYDQETCDHLFTAGALHDIGKLLISNDILEKPGKLTQDEYIEIQNHALGTWELLKNIGGLEEITRWAALHHEKLDGSGYPFGLEEEYLVKNERLMACLDIYQALVEERPYKAGMSHADAMAILRKMGNEGQLDKDIINDIDEHFGTDAETVPTVKVAEERIYEGEAWKCPVCGYVYEGDLPEDFICPQCEQPGSIFEKIS